MGEFMSNDERGGKETEVSSPPRRFSFILAARLRFYSSPAIAIHCHSAPPQGS